MDKNNNIEKEIRFYFPAKKLAVLKKKLREIRFCGSYYEMTAMYNNPNPKYDFYNKNVDGRLRLRQSVSLRNKTKGVGLLSWKQRIPGHLDKSIRKEKEVEFKFNISDYNNVKHIIEKVLRCPIVSSYERRRHYYSTANFSITLDEFPFGLMLEFEFKKNKISKTQIAKTLKLFDLKLEDASKLSCDDMYLDICLKNHKKNKPNISFSDRNMSHL